MKEFVEKLIERLEERIDGNKKYTSSPMGNDARNQIIGLKKAIEIVKDLASEYNNGWISVEDALPKEKGTYLVTVKHFGVTFARFTGQKDNLHFDANVIAWQPLPAPYKKGE